jgi:hypothetical protein
MAKKSAVSVPEASDIRELVMERGKGVSFVGGDFVRCIVKHEAGIIMVTCIPDNDDKVEVFTEPMKALKASGLKPETLKDGPRMKRLCTYITDGISGSERPWINPTSAPVVVVEGRANDAGMLPASTEAPAA